MWTVYKHINLQNNKIYIGITSQPVEDRWKNGNGYKNNQIFYEDIQKYGWKEGFLHEILIIVDIMIDFIICLVLLHIKISHQH